MLAPRKRPLGMQTWPSSRCRHRRRLAGEGDRALAKEQNDVITLDPTAAYGEALSEREGVSYFVANPAHLPIYNDETDPEARRDYFGSGKAKPAIVNALMQGPEESYSRYAGPEQ